MGRKAAPASIGSICNSLVSWGSGNIWNYVCDNHYLFYSLFEQPSSVIHIIFFQLSNFSSLEFVKCISKCLNSMVCELSLNLETQAQYQSCSRYSADPHPSQCARKKTDFYLQAIIFSFGTSLISPSACSHPSQIRTIHQPYLPSQTHTGMHQSHFHSPLQRLFQLLSACSTPLSIPPKSIPPSPHPAPSSPHNSPNPLHPTPPTPPMQTMTALKRIMHIHQIQDAFAFAADDVIERFAFLGWGVVVGSNATSRVGG